MGKHKWEKDIFSFIHLDRKRLRKRKERKENRKIDLYKPYKELLQYNITLQNYRHILHSISSCHGLLTRVGVSM